MAMVFCRGCGKEIHESALSCPQCGAQQRQAASNGNTNPLRERVIKEVSSSKVSFVDHLLFFPFRMFRKLVLTESHLLLTNSGKTRIYVDIPLSDITSVGYANSGSLAIPFWYLAPTAIAISTTTGKFKFHFGLLNYSKRKEWVEAIKAQTSGMGAQSFSSAAQPGRLQPSLDASPLDGKRPAIVVGAVVVALLAIGLFSSMKEKTNAEIMAAPPPVSTVTAPSSSSVGGQIPQPTAAFNELYQVAPTANGTANLNDGQIASLYYAATFMTEAGQRHLIFVQRSKPGQESYADGGNIDVVSFRNDGGQWVPDAQARGVFAAGAYGGTAALNVEQSAKVERHALRDDVTGVFLPSSTSHQGYSTDFLEIVGVGPRNIGYLGQVEVAGNNEGACDPAEKSGAQACYDWKGKVEVAAVKPGQFSRITVKKTGTEHAGPAIVQASNLVYTKHQDGGYAAPND